MKKIFAILLLIVHLFNAGGYRMFFSLAENNADEQMAVALNKNNYNEDELLQIKFALNTPYIQNHSGYERCDGEIEYNGAQYNYVKRMIRNDTLYLYCIPNNEKTNISNTKNLYATQNADNASGKPPDQTALKKTNLLSEYNPGILSFHFAAHHYSITQTIAFNNLTTLKGFTTKHLQPPDLFI